MTLSFVLLCLACLFSQFIPTGSFHAIPRPVKPDSGIQRQHVGRLESSGGRRRKVSSLTAAVKEKETATDDDSWQAPQEEIKRRRTFAIISHPDAGKTTLTEKLLLYGGAIQEAGAVKARRDQRKATSDFMELEKQRGISVSSTVMSFEYNALRYNLLDTPGHQDFSEDTYRTLAAADQAVLLVDAAKGIEVQTRKLFEVCRLRRLPIFTFANKMDRPGLAPLDLVDHIQSEFNMDMHPVVWPIGSGSSFMGVVNRLDNTVHLYSRGQRTKKAGEDVMALDFENPSRLIEALGEETVEHLKDELELLEGVLNPLSDEEILAGRQSPMFFGSAMNNFGVQLFLDNFAHLARTPAPMKVVEEESAGGVQKVRLNEWEDPDTSEDQGSALQPDHPEFSAFIFKLQANLDPKHRDRLAFARIVSGKFKKGMQVSHSRRKGRLRLSQAQSLFANDKETLDEAYPGDVIGLNNPGAFAIGDTIYTGGKPLTFPGIPSFSPECFAYIRNVDPQKNKQWTKGITQLLEEGAVQMLKQRGDMTLSRPILAAVGILQLDVVKFRLESEYGVETQVDNLPTYSVARWIQGGSDVEADWGSVDRLEKEGKLFGCMITQDRWERPVVLFRNKWSVESLEASERESGLILAPWAFAPREKRK
uniref:Tr-type G domain-containing protein n=1 Tax=Chromera velia CCMP2878 TaxID=1169474 RepID=A0A0K6S9G5_9ALVE|eukprot:Cvel_7147.t2-p1 / transcript=Cvel_7147.t2 / gene=Cvel_7147 / organism=Chromera_velia_CCMP2878 / gene_product=Peptide chain release factor 3, putative / transcript_product=Peptide chain release factor 3, putative / location=Cvel_scaffold367:55183-64149(-) / protein_length=647 / sequence_SO=supercontig / SO=protein_coding / is_pseudo=false